MNLQSTSVVKSEAVPVPEQPTAAEIVAKRLQDAGLAFLAHGDRLFAIIKTPEGTPEGRDRSVCINLDRPYPYVLTCSDARLTWAVRRIKNSKLPDQLARYGVEWQSDPEVLCLAPVLHLIDVPAAVIKLREAVEAIIWCAGSVAERTKDNGETSVLEATFLELQTDIDRLGDQIDRFGWALAPEVKELYDDAYGDLRSALETIRCQSCENVAMSEIRDLRRLCATCVEVRA